MAHHTCGLFFTRFEDEEKKSWRVQRKDKRRRENLALSVRGTWARTG